MGGWGLEVEDEEERVVVELVKHLPEGGGAGAHARPLVPSTALVQRRPRKLYGKQAALLAALLAALPYINS